MIFFNINRKIISLPLRIYLNPYGFTWSRRYNILSAVANYVYLSLLLLLCISPYSRVHHNTRSAFHTADRGKCQGLGCRVRKRCLCLSFIGACVCEKPFWFFRNFARLLAPPTSAHAQPFQRDDQPTGQQQFRGTNDQCFKTRTATDIATTVRQ
jgi:hypothetical protein